MKTKDNFLEGAKVTKDNQIFGTGHESGAKHGSPQSVPPAERGNGSRTKG
jgi:hypothetical protein